MVEFHSLKCTPPSSRGPGRSPFKAKTGVRIPVGAQKRLLGSKGRSCFKYLNYYALSIPHEGVQVTQKGTGVKTGGMVPVGGTGAKTGLMQCTLICYGEFSYLKTHRFI